MINYITSRTNQKIKEVASLKVNKYRQEKKLFLAEGYKALEMAISSKLIKEVYSLHELDIPSDIPLYIVTEEILEKITITGNPDGVVFVCNYPSFKAEGNKFIYLDKISDPGNMGTIIRTALSLSYDAVLCSPGCVSPYNEKVVSASKGSIFKIPVVEADLKDFKDDYQIIVSALHKNSTKLPDLKTEEKFVLVLGNEAHGVSVETLKLSDVIVEIPIKDMESLNVAIAGAILMYELNKNS